MELYLIRHGLTVWNAAGKLQGNTDIELNEQGREAAGQLGIQLDNVSFDIIYSSPLIRAYETACLIRGNRNIPIVRDKRLRELSFGEKEGVCYVFHQAIFRKSDGALCVRARVDCAATVNGRLVASHPRLEALLK